MIEATGAAIPTNVPDLSGVTLADLRADLRAGRSPEMAAAIEGVLKQVARPRVNLGGNGPPGRAD